ncbi:MAG: ComEA family DNA-binding protein [Anaerolineae bacterium]|nr:ComEA family DNA-binding protein [Anaerolineae bacterium]
MTDRIRAILLFGLVVVALAGAAWFQVRRTPTQSILLSPATAGSETATPFPTSTPSPLRIYVSGAVRHPEVYILQPGAIVKDALLAAGGASDDADLDRINLAAPVGDGQHVHVPRYGEAAVTALPSDPYGSRAAPGGVGERVNINTATQAELETLPGIGPSLAARIVAHREAHGPFAAPEDVTEVSGIGPAIFEKIRDLITIN